MECVAETPEGAVISVRAQPRSSRPGLDAVAGGALKVRIKSAPVDGKANKELVETIAGAFGVAKSRVELKSGQASKTKRVLLRGVSAGEAEAAIREACA